MWHELPVGDLKCPYRAHWLIVRELTVGIGCVRQKLHAVVCMADLSAVTLSDSVIRRLKAFEVGDVFVQSGHQYSWQIRSQMAI